MVYKYFCTNWLLKSNFLYANANEEISIFNFLSYFSLFVVISVLRKM